MILNHATINWNDERLNEVMLNARTLILGSFNPNNPINGQNTDFYYGRNTNHFWKSISRNLHFNEDFFLNNLQNKIDYMSKYKFCFYDIINSIEYLSNNEEILNQYVQEKIFTNYSDNELFRVRPFTYNNSLIQKNLNFNYAILDLLNNSKIKKVVHTLGNNRITQNLIANPINENLAFNPFINGIIDSCNDNQIEFFPISYSPSQFAVNLGGQNYMTNLDNWIAENVLNN